MLQLLHNSIILLIVVVTHDECVDNDEALHPNIEPPNCHTQRFLLEGV